jgi:hypothetical protein
LKDTGKRAVVVLDFNKEQQGFSHNTLDPLTAQAAVAGVFFVAYDWADPPAGSVLWSNNKPIFSMVRLGYAKPASEELVTLAATIKNLPKDPTSPAGYTVVYAHFWGTTVSDLVSLQTLLGPEVAVVSPETLIELATTNITPKE